MSEWRFQHPADSQTLVLSSLPQGFSSLLSQPKNKFPGMLRVVQYSDKFMRGHFIVLFSHYNTEQKHNNKEQSKAMRNFKKPCINLSEYWTSMGISLGLTPGKANDETAYYIEGLILCRALKTNPARLLNHIVLYLHTVLLHPHAPITTCWLCPILPMNRMWVF